MIRYSFQFREPNLDRSSNDPEFWDIWTGKKERVIDWDKIVGDWQGSQSPEPEEEEEDLL